MFFDSIYSWAEISNVVNHKRLFNIEFSSLNTDKEKSVSFTLPDADTGRYFWKLCVLQHTFFMKYEQNQVHPSVEQNLNLFQNVPEDLNESRDNLFVEQSSSNIYASDSHIPASVMWNQPNQTHHNNNQNAEWLSRQICHWQRQVNNYYVLVIMIWRIETVIGN